MADKKLNEVTKVTDMAYVPVIMADGSIGQIAKADLASVVAGIIGFGLPYRGVLSSVSQFNGAIELGSYRYGGSLSTELGTSNYGTVVVFPADIYIAQIIIGPSFSFRISYDGGKVWSSWK